VEARIALRLGQEIEDFASTNGLIEVHERYSLSYPLTIRILLYLFRLIYKMDMYRTARHDSQLLNHNVADFSVSADLSTSITRKE
jgi:hypothetical protein